MSGGALKREKRGQPVVLRRGDRVESNGEHMMRDSPKGAKDYQSQKKGRAWNGRGGNNARKPGHPGVHPRQKTF